ncbi:unnamed protein product [Closterium sp. NIES-53]
MEVVAIEVIVEVVEVEVVEVVVEVVEVEIVEVVEIGATEVCITGGAEREGVEPGGAASEGAESGGAEPQGAATSGGSSGASLRQSPQQLREWFVRRAHLQSGATGARGAGDARAGGAGVAAGAAGAGGAGVATGASGAGGTAAIGPRGARTRGTGAAGTGGVEGARVVGPSGAGAAGAGAGGTGVVDPCAGGARGTVWPRVYFVPLLQQVLGTPSSTGLTPPLLCPPPDHSHPPLQPASPLPAPSPYTWCTRSFNALASSSPGHSPLLCLPATRSQLHLRTSPTSGMGLVLGGRGPVVLTSHADAYRVDNLATQRSSQGYTSSLGSGSVSWRSTRSSLVLSSSCEAQIYAGAMAAQELRWLIYLLTDLGEKPRSPLVLYVDNKAMIALCQEHRLEQRGQLRLAYVATWANTADVFTKALPSGDHQRFATLLLCFS